MKLTIVHMIVGLITVVGLSIYFGQPRPILPAEAFQLAQPVTAHGIVPIVAEEPFVEEPFVDKPLVEEQFIGSSAPIVSVSNTGYDAMSLKQRSDMIKQVQEMIRSELLAARQLHNLKDELHEEEDELHEEEEEETHHYRRPSEFQGRDFYRRSERSSDSCNEQGEEEYRCPKNPDGSCPPVPDMTDYIRKDQIPCWGCSIDY